LFRSKIGAERAAYAAGVGVRRVANRKRFICVMASSARSNCSGVSIIEDYLHNTTLSQQPVAMSQQLIEQRLGLLQVGRVKALGEPAVDLGEQLAGFSTLALGLPQLAQAHGRSQFQ